MQITCPSCGNISEVDGELPIGQHLVCPFCSQQFSYSGVEQEDTSSRDIQSEESIQEGITVKCPSCGAEYEVDKRFEGATCQCSVCNKEFVAKKLVMQKRWKLRTSTSADRLKSIDPKGENHLSVRRKARSRVLTVLCILLVAGVLGGLIFKTMKNSNVEVKNGGTEATNDSPDEQYNLGIRYYKGEGVAQDRAEAVRRFRMAAEQGHAKAQTLLGLCYGVGDGVSQDEKEALNWIRKAAEQGFAQAQFHLGDFYANGVGVTEDHEVAVQWYRKAAEQGDASAQNALGMCHYEGEGVWQSLTEAAKWFRKAAEQGHAEAQYNLGMRYLLGEGVKRDGVEARGLFDKAAEQGHAEAQFQLGIYYSFDAASSGSEMSRRQSIMWFRKAARQGHETAKHFLRSKGVEF